MLGRILLCILLCKITLLFIRSPYMRPQDMQRPLYMRPQDALQYNIIDEVIQPNRWALNYKCLPKL